MRPEKPLSVARQDIDSSDLPLMLKLVEEMPTSENTILAGGQVTEKKWRTWVDQGTKANWDYHWD